MSIRCDMCMSSNMAMEGESICCDDCGYVITDGIDTVLDYDNSSHQYDINILNKERAMNLVNAEINKFLTMFGECDESNITKCRQIYDRHIVKKGITKRGENRIALYAAIVFKAIKEKKTLDIRTYSDKVKINKSKITEQLKIIYDEDECENKLKEIQSSIEKIMDEMNLPEYTENILKMAERIYRLDICCNRTSLSIACGCIRFASLVGIVDKKISNNDIKKYRKISPATINLMMRNEFKKYNKYIINTSNYEKISSVCNTYHSLLSNSQYLELLKNGYYVNIDYTLHNHLMETYIKNPTDINKNKYVNILGYVCVKNNI